MTAATVVVVGVGVVDVGIVVADMGDVGLWRVSLLYKSAS